MMYKAIIVEDEKLNAELLNTMIHDFIPDLEVIGMCANMADAYKEIRQHEHLIIFLDIELSGEHNGFDLLKIIENEGHNVIVVSAFPNYAVKAFRASTVDYILKPVRISELIDAVDKVKRKVELEKKASSARSLASNEIMIQLHNKFVNLFLNDIVAVKSEEKRSQIILSNGEVLHSLERIGEVELKLKEGFFYRVHQSYIVNIKYVTALYKVEGSQFVELQNKHEVPVSRR